MKRIRRFKQGFTQSLFGKPKGKISSMDVYGAHILNSKFIWAFAK